ncbi:MAG TPA: glycosyltransferase family 4 protein [Gemmatimonadales bacterium]|nr:glycosyltransferase family 4 protein [Gemmatimonadales bacterium]
MTRPTAAMLPRAPRPARILMTADTVGGVWAYALELSRALTAAGVEVTLAAMGGEPSEDQRAEAQAVPGLALETSRWRLPWMESPWDDVRAAGEWLLALAERTRPDLVHHNEPVYAALPWRVPTLALGHSCVLSWWRAVHATDAPPEWDRYREAMTRGFDAAGAVAAPSTPMLVALQEHYGVRGGHVIPNGRDPAGFAPGRKMAFVLTAGRVWDSAKNVAAVGRVAPRLAWPVYVAGEERHPDSGGAASTEHLHFIGRLPTRELARWYARAPIFALPARYEPFGLGPLEAGLAGCALVLGDLPSLREVWGDAALYVPPDDTDALHAALAGLVADAARRAEYGRRARARALEYGPERMARGYLELYAALLARGRSDTPPMEPAACAS